MHTQVVGVFDCLEQAHGIMDQVDAKLRCKERVRCTPSVVPPYLSYGIAPSAAGLPSILPPRPTLNSGRWLRLGDFGPTGKDLSDPFYSFPDRLFETTSVTEENEPVHISTSIQVSRPTSGHGQAE